MGAVGGGQKRSGRQITLITPEGFLGFGIEVDEALRVGDCGFLGESDTGESDPPSFLHQLQCPWPKDPNICSLRSRNHPILI